MKKELVLTLVLAMFCFSLVSAGRFVEINGTINIRSDNVSSVLESGENVLGVIDLASKSVSGLSSSLVFNQSPVVYLFPQLNSTSTTRIFTFNVSDDSEIANCTVYTFDSSNVSYNSSFSDSINKSENISLNVSGFVAGNYTAYVNCTDSLSYVGKSNTIVFEVIAETTTEEEEETTSSGGGSAGPLSYSVSESSLENGVTRNLRKNDGFKFNSNNESHNLTINNISNESISLTVYSVPQSFTMKLGDILNVDLNNDGVKDIEISYLKYYRNLVSLKIRAIELPYDLPKNETENETSTGAPYGLDEISDEDVRAFGRNLIIGLAVVLVVILVAVAVLMIRLIVKRRRKSKRK